MIVLDRRDPNAEQNKKELDQYKKSLRQLEKYYPKKVKCSYCKSTFVVESIEDFKKSREYPWSNTTYGCICPVCTRNLGAWDSNDKIIVAQDTVDTYHRLHPDAASEYKTREALVRQDTAESVLLMQLFIGLYNEYTKQIWGIMIGWLVLLSLIIVVAMV